MSEELGRVRLSELFEPIASSLGIPLMTVSQVSKYLRIAGLLPAARARKLGTAFVGPDEAATLLLGILGSDTIQGGSEAVFRLSGLRLSAITARYTAPDGSVTERFGFHGILSSENVPGLWLQPLHTMLSEMIASPCGGSDDTFLAHPLGIWVSRTRPLAVVEVAFDCPDAVKARVAVTFAPYGEDGYPPKLTRELGSMEVSAAAPAEVLLSLNAALNADAADYPVNNAAVH